MATGLEGVGEAVTGGMAARAVEPEAGEPRACNHAHGDCLNCGTALIGNHCHQCGQSGHVHRSLGAFWHDVAHSVLHFDGKIWRTLPLLALRPGDLTRRYIEGERAKFVSPMALFLFSVFLMFAVFSTIGGPIAFSSPVDRAEATADLREEQAEARRNLQRLEAERRRLVAAGASTSAVDLSIQNIRRELTALHATARVIASGSDTEVEEATERGFEAGEMDVASFNTGWEPLDAAIRKANDNPSLLLYKTQTNAYKYSWALIPISVPFLWLLFLHRRRYRAYGAYDHIVFITYSISFMSLGLIALSLLRPLGLGDNLIGVAISFIPPIHIYRQLRGAYGLSRWSAVWRTFVLIVFAMLAASLFLSLLIALGALS